MYKEDLALDNQQWLICHKIQTNPTKTGEQCHLTLIILTYQPLRLIFFMTASF